MTIVIDCFKQIKGNGKSIGIYNVALSLIQNLVKEKSRTKNKEIKSSKIIILGNTYNEIDFNIKGVRFIKVPNYNPRNKLHCIVWELFGVTRFCKKLKADKVLFPRGYCACTHPIDDIVLIHDMIPFYYKEHFPDTFPRVENAYIMKRLRLSAESAKQIITISEASKKDILKYCDVDENKISVIYNACNAISFCEDKMPQHEAYICAMTSKLPHKNARGILESYRKYCENEETPLQLIVIGIPDVLDYDLPEDVKSNITCYQFIEDNNEIYRIIANSSVFMFLSLMEGFGLPPIEAMQLKVPVICSNVSSLPEVVGDSAILVDPENPENVACALHSLLTNIPQQTELINKGLDNVKRFSWESRAKEYWDVLLRK